MKAMWRLIRQLGCWSSSLVLQTYGNVDWVERQWNPTFQACSRLQNYRVMY
jgi:hypothetical protein